MDDCASKYRLLKLTRLAILIILATEDTEVNPSRINQTLSTKYEILIPRPCSGQAKFKAPKI